MGCVTPMTAMSLLEHPPQVMPLRLDLNQRLSNLPGHQRPMPIRPKRNLLVGVHLVGAIQRATRRHRCLEPPGLERGLWSVFLLELTEHPQRQPTLITR